MKPLITIAVLLPLAGCTLPAQTETLPPPAPSAVVMPADFSAEQLDQLLGPIALYPDALIALILPASTNSADIVLASRFLQAGGDPNQAEAQPWDESVQALAHYPQVVQWMDQNLVWTKQLGEAFAAQPTEVMNSIQRLRAKARAAGTLVDTPQQQVVYQGSTIYIVPTQPDVIYVPYYDPAVVYYRDPYYYGYSPNVFFGFSSGFTTGLWLSYGLDWHSHRVWNIGHEERERYWREHHRDWNRHVDWDHDRTHPYPAPDRRTWHPRTDSITRSGAEVRQGTRPETARPRWNDVPRSDISHQTGNQPRRPEAPASRPGPRGDIVGPPAAPQPARASSVPTVQPLPQVGSTTPVGPGEHRGWNRGNPESRYNPPARPVGVGPAPTPITEGRAVVPNYSAPQVRTAPEPRRAPVYSAPAAPRYVPQPQYSGSRPQYSAPAAAPQAAPHYSPPAAAPRYSAPPPHYSPPPSPPPQSAPPPSSGGNNQNGRNNNNERER